MTSSDILRSVARRHGFTVSQLQAPTKVRRLVRARAEAMIELRAANYSLGRIALLLRRNKSTVEYVVYPRVRAAKVRHYHARKAAA